MLEDVNASRPPIRVTLNATSKGVSFKTNTGRRGVIQVRGHFTEQLSAVRDDLLRWFRDGEGHSDCLFTYSQSTLARLTQVQNAAQRMVYSAEDLIRGSSNE